LQFWYFSTIDATSGTSNTLSLWLSGGMYAQVPRGVAVTFLEVWVESDQQPVVHLHKQQRPTARITAVHHQCLLTM
jgi:hypothetical protein